MTRHHKEAIEYLVRETGDAGLNAGAVIGLHAFLSDGLMTDPRACGRIRINTLHAGNAVRFGFRPPEFAAWKEKLSAGA